MKLKIHLLYILLAAGLNGFPQTGETFVIVDAESGMPLPSVNLLFIKSTVKGVTNSLGEFRIPGAVEQGEELLISSVGYQEMKLAVDTLLLSEKTIRLAPLTNMLQEVTVSTGYQSLSRTASTGSFNSISKSLYNEQVGPTVLNRLEAIANGLSFDRSISSSQLMVRGLSTIQGPKDPLIIVDNFPYEGDINNLNPNTIDQITILKDAAASSIWGARAGNGVIVISTKKGMENQPLTIEFTSNLSVGTKPDLYKSKQIASADFIELEKWLFSVGHYDGELNSPYYPVVSPVVELLAKQRTEGISTAEQVETMKKDDIRGDLLKYAYERPVDQQYFINFSGGGNTFAWLVSGGYDKNISTLDAASERLTFRSSNSFHPFNRLTVSTDIAYSNTHSVNGNLGYGEIGSKGTAIYPYARLADDSGHPLSIPKNYRKGFLDTTGNGLLLPWEYFPLTDQHETSQSVNRQDILTNISLRYDLTPDWGFDLKYQYERQQTTGREFYSPQSFFTRDLVNQYTEISGSGAERRIPLGGILDQPAERMNAHNFRGQVNFHKDFGQHALNIIAGTDIRSLNAFGNVYRLYGYDDGNLTFSNVDLTRTYPNYLLGYSDYIPGRNSLSDKTTRFLSFYGNGIYTLYRKYIFSFSARRDGSNVFGVSTNDRWKPLWSAGLAWDIAAENLPLHHPFSEFKLRASYGVSGNTNPAMSAVTTIEYVATSPYTSSPYARFNKTSNKELRWEQSRMMNVGLDFSTRTGRISGSFEFYTKKGTDLFGTSPIDYTIGIGNSITANVASMSGRGTDLALHTLNTTGKLKWQTSLNLSHYTDKVSEYYLESQQASFFVTPQTAISGLEGKPVYSLFSFAWAGLDPQNGDPMGYAGDDVSKDYAAFYNSSTQAADLIYHGPVLPKWFGSVGNTFKWKELSITGRFVFKFGHFFRRQTISYNSLVNDWQGHSDYALRWQNPGDEKDTTIPSFQYPVNYQRDNFFASSAVNVLPAGFLRFQYLNMAYDLSRFAIRHVRNGQLYINIENLGLIYRTNKEGIDPEYRGQSYGNDLPPGRNVSIGVRFSI